MARRFGVYGSEQRGPGQVPELLARHTFWGDDGALLATGDSFTCTAVNVTPACNSVDGKPMVELAGAGAGTDGYQVQSLGAGIRPQSGKLLKMAFIYRSADVANHEFGAGFAAADTSQLASEATDALWVRQLTTETVLTARARKASGTALTAPIGMDALVNDTTYFGELFLERSATAGKGRMRFYWLASPTPGAQCEKVLDVVFPTQFADTVDLAPFLAWRAGGAVTTKGYFGLIGWEVEW